MLLRNTIKFAHMALSLVPKILYAVDVISLVCKKCKLQVLVERFVN